MFANIKSLHGHNVLLSYSDADTVDDVLGRLRTQHAIDARRGLIAAGQLLDGDLRMKDIPDVRSLTCLHVV